MRTEEQKQKQREATARWRAKNPSYEKEYYSKNSSKINARLLEWNVKNPEYRRSTMAMRHVVVGPKNKLASHYRSEIKQIYRLAHTKTIETGIVHVVDHIIPIGHKDVTGLHVPWNLRVITDAENKSKSGRLCV
jgi:5-methylcytosine-specific restriction endonuclease McrA